MREIPLSQAETLIRDALPRATDEEVAFLVSRFAGRSFHIDHAELFRPFTDRETPQNRVRRIQRAIGCIVTGRFNGWDIGPVSLTVTRIVEAAVARA